MIRSLSSCLATQKPIDGLAAVIQERFARSSCSTSFFVFGNQRRDKLKIEFLQFLADSIYTDLNKNLPCVHSS
ncbi:IS66 family insertion sequence element accessory protein TnpB [Paenibacillus sp. GCM10012307]|uniref:IS66 family insertion sequence element accessory protein TnpB n=1 Tax=Paenibacillus roseus TaxID=2798579 RepID=A0A934J854_9BACL|nr:IS66 family insertion sequence element accessory protein TnpB [Paenibacillus roseus]